MDTSTSSSTSSGELPDPNPNKSYEVVPPPGECISSLCFSPKADYLVATSWDSQVNVWEIQRLGATTKSVARATMEYDLPDLCSTWKDDESTVFSGGCDKVVKMWQLVSGLKPSPVGMHDGPVKEIAWIPDMNLLVTGSWDKTLRYWDLKQKNRLVHRKQLPDRCYALDVKYPLMVVGTADRNLVVFDLRRPQEELKRIQSPLKCQTRCVAVFPDKQGFLVGSTEGRVGVHHLDDSQRAKNLTFKCHREGNQIYSVNSLNFHPVHHTFATAGSDGAFNFWDKDSKRKLKAASRCLNPIPCSAFNSDGSMYAYAVCYDWSEAVPNPSTSESSIYIHLPEESEVKGKPPRAGKDGM